VVHDLRRGIPADASSVRAVYHSHVLTQIDRDQIPNFFAEIRRVLEPNGVHRIVVPDFARLTRDYIAHFEASMADSAHEVDHDDYIAAMIELMVRKKSLGSSQQPALRRFVENAVLGDARRRGETYQWMYDEVNLRHLLVEAGFRSISVVNNTTSSIPKWDAIALDQDPDGSEYKPGSLYVECLK
jgi:ubiquinone/menaquinone biosynthesis C-methylase UbiE